MTIQQLKYIIMVAEIGSITEAAKALFISQPSLSSAIREIEAEAKITIFSRSRQGVALTKEGLEFLGYARNVVQQMELLEDKYVTNTSEKIRFAVSTQHYTFTSNAFVEMVERFGQERYEFILNETRTRQIMEDVKNRFSDLGILFLSNENEAILRKELSERGLIFHELFSSKPHVFLSKDHPLAKKSRIRLAELDEYPRLNFIQGNYESSYWSEELFSSRETEKHIRISDRGAIVNLMIGMNAYTVSSGIFPKYLQGEEIVAIPLAEKEVMHIGYILNEKQELTELGAIYIEELRKYGST
ncbi:MAG: LysR family transcriptional regulator [Bulleidia sp.]|jgi:DNA-binding transcriptional LysR family regulator|nr:LysR family transcriptional regulator [Bulleidia sp.]